VQKVDRYFSRDSPVWVNSVFSPFILPGCAISGKGGFMINWMELTTGLLGIALGVLLMMALIGTGEKERIHDAYLEGYVDGKIECVRER
jgi:hypothetical protein